MSNYVKLRNTWSSPSTPYPISVGNKVNPNEHNQKLQQLNPSDIDFCMCNPDSCSVPPHAGGCKQGDYNSDCMFACNSAASGSISMPRDCIPAEGCSHTYPNTLRCRSGEGGTTQFPGPSDFTCMTQCNGDTLCYRTTNSPCCKSDTDCSYIPGSYCNNGSCHGAPIACPTNN